MELNPIVPQIYDKKPPSQATRGWFDSKVHPLLSTQVLVRLRTQLPIEDWLLVGAVLQSSILLIVPLNLVFLLAPTFALAIYKVTRLFLVCFGVLENKHMRGVRLERQSAVFPEPDGGLSRPSGKTVGGEGMCIILLTSKVNHPLGIFYPPAKEFFKHAKAMYKDLERNSEEFGFLGMSDYLAVSTQTCPTTLGVMYFRSIEHLHKFAHAKVHRAGWDWWEKGEVEGKLNCLTIGHEVYVVEAGKWENISMHTSPYDFGATSHPIKDASGQRKFVCPVVNANGKKFKSSAARMSTVEI